jgi:hypothetical protein
MAACRHAVFEARNDAELITALRACVQDSADDLEPAERGAVLMRAFARAQSSNARIRVLELYTHWYDDDSEAHCPLSTLSPLHRITKCALDDDDQPVLRAAFSALRHTIATYCGILLMCRDGDWSYTLTKLSDALPDEKEEFEALVKVILDQYEDYPQVLQHFSPLIRRHQANWKPPMGYCPPDDVAFPLELERIAKEFERCESESDSRYESEADSDS